MNKNIGYRIGGFSPNDGTIDFYLRVGSLGGSESIYLDLGAGRGAWFEDDHCKTRRTIRDMRSKFKKVVGADVDKVVLQNRSIEDVMVIVDGKLPFKDATFDIICCDYVLEHIEDVRGFVAEIDRILKPGGWFCARTPHLYNYVAIATRLLPDRTQQIVLGKAQPERREHDVFPKHYRLNRIYEITAAFKDYDNHSFLFRSDPAYYFGRKLVYDILSVIHRILPVALCGNIFAFMRKPNQSMSSVRAVEE